LTGRFFANVDVRAVGNAAISDADKNASSIRKTSDADERTERQAIMRCG
jgi:hypothetical protein